MKLTANIVTSIICILFGFQLTQAQCDGTNDIIQSDGGRNYILNTANGFLSTGNSFTATCSGPIDGISFWTGEIPGTIGGVSITVELYRNPFSNSRVLLASLTNDISFSNSTTPRENYFEFDNHPELISGTLYGFRIVINDNNQPMQLKINSPSNSNPYTGGRQFTNNFEQTSSTQDQDLRFQIHYQDNVAPIVNCRNITRTLGADGTVSINANNINNGATDADSGVATLALSRSSFDCATVGNNIVTLSAIDQNGNTSNCQATVTIIDETPPVITCPDNMTVFTDPETPVVVNYADIIYDDCTIEAAPNGFTFLTARNGKSYFLSQFKQPAPVAYSFCQALGGHLATIENEEHNTIIRSAADAIVNTEGILIGYNDLVSEGNFVWHSGSSSTYTNWASAEPNDNLDSEDFTEIRADGKWNDFYGLEMKYFVLELPRVNMTQTSGLPSGATFPLGITTNTFEATDASGNTATCSFTVEVVESFKIIHVNAAAATNGNGETWSTAYKYLQDALQDANSSGSNIPVIEIWVADGVYYPDEDEAGNVTNNNRNESFALQDRIALLGGFNGTETSKDQRNPAQNITILSGDIGQDDTNTDGNNIAEDVNDIVNNNSFHVVTSLNTDTTAIIDGFTVTAGNAGNQNGGGMLIVEGSPQVNQMHFIGNKAKFGGAMNVINSSSNITNTKFTANTATDDSGAVEIIEQNANTNLNITLTNILFANNTSGNDGGALGVFGFFYTRFSLSNATFYGNSASRNGSAMYATLLDRIHIKNSIFYNNDGQDVFLDGNDVVNVSHNYFQETFTHSGASNNLQNQPDPFIDAANGDFQLNNQSTAIDSGDNTATSLALDLAGNPRTYDDTLVTDTGIIGSGTAVIDMGAYERQENSAKIIYVNAAAATNGDGNSWGTAYKYLQDALQDASSNASNSLAIEIWVAEGVYYPDEDEAGNVTNNNRNATFQLLSNVRLLGGFNGTETSKSQRNPEENSTILSGDIGQDDTNTDGNNIAENTSDIMNNNSFHIVTGSNANNTAIIDGFTITAGNAGNQDGGGMFIDTGSPQLNQLHFIGNTANYGGAMYITDGSSTITNTKFTYNTSSSDSGAIEIAEQNINSNVVTLTNILFANNTTGGSGGALGGFGNEHLKVSITNATFYGNSASGSGGAVFVRLFNTIDIRNSIFYNNTGQDVSFALNSSFNVSYSYLQETYIYPGGSNNLQNRPNPFVDAANGDFQLKNQSTAIDAGDNTANNLILDLAGNPRTYNDAFITDTGNIGSGSAVIDMGAYERQEDSCNNDTNNDGICDTEDPVAVCQDISLETDFGGITVTGDQLDGGSTDNIDIVEFLINGQTSIDLTIADLGDTQVTLTVVDGDGNTSDCTATITITSNVTFDVFISEYQPVVDSQNTDQQIELTGEAGEAFAGTLVVIEGDVQTGNEGVVMASYDISGTFDANNLLVATIPNIPDPTHTVVLTSAFNGTVGGTYVDNGDGTVDTSEFGVIFDALGSSNGGVCCPIDIIYGDEFGGIDLAYIGERPYAVFRESSTGDFYQMTQTGIIYDSTGNSVDGTLFNTTPTINGTFGSINPSRLITLEAKVYLQGASLNPNVGQEQLMRDDLRVAGLLPTASPYGDVSTDAMMFSDVEPNNAIVDWVWVELRDAANNMTVIAAQSALLQRDGDIVSVEGTTVKFNAESGNYYIAIKHRNHIGIMSANTITLSATETTINFADGSTPTYGTNAQTSFGTPSGIVAMWAGNANDDSIIQYSGTNPDTPEILSEVLNDAGNFLNFPTYTISGYNTKDINMDGNTQYSGTSPDTPIILQNALAHPGNFLNFSTYEIIEQLPENE